MRRHLGTIIGRAATPLFVALVAAAAIAVHAPAGTGAVDLPETQPVLGVQGQVHYLPFDANDFLATLRGQNDSGSAASPVRLITSIVSALDGNQVVIDHWEDGYDADPIAAPGPTTETYAMDEGDNRIFNNLVAVPRPDDSSAPIRYDGGDKIVSTGAVVVTAGGWASGSGTLHAGAVAVRNANSAGLEFVSPVGEDTTYAAPNAALSSLWDYTGLIVVATQDGTTVTLPDGTTQALDEGDSHLVNGGVHLGDTVTADRPVSVYLSTGDPVQDFEGRMFNLLPTSAWSDSYVTPVGSRTNAAYKSRVFLYNPGDADITVTAATSGGSSSPVTVPAHGQANYLLPANQGVRFSSTGNPFYAVEAITTPESGSTDNSSSHNWGFALTPERALTPMVVIGYGPGSDDFDANGSVDANDSAVWVSSQSDTTIYIDLDADPDTGGSTDPDGNQYDFSCTATALTPVLLKDVGSASCSTISGYTRSTGSGDNDMTGARIYTTDGVSIAAAWGQVPETANPGTPAIDMGTTVLPFPTIDLDKSSEVVNDDGDGKAVPGDTIRYTVTITNRGISPVDDLSLNDQVPANTTYVPGTTTAGGTPVADPQTGTPFPFDEGGMLVPPVLDVGQTRVVTFDLLVDDPLPPGVTDIVNHITLESDYGTYEDDDDRPVADPGSIGDRVWNDADGDGVQDGGETGLTGVTVELRNDEGDVIATSTTGANGGYTFDEVYPGTYTVRIDPASLPPSAAATFDLDGIGTAHQATLTLAESQDRTDADFGYATATITLQKTVYAGHNGGNSCPGSELVSGENGDDVTYCFRVTNTGAVALVGVTVDDPDLDGGIDQSDMSLESGNPAALAAGQSVVWSYNGQIDGDLVNTATATALLSVGGPSRTATDTAEVNEIGPGIALEKTVYLGHDGGTSCGTSLNAVSARAGGAVTYCFEVTNTGETNLSAVTFSDPDLGIDEGDLVHALLTPGQSHTFTVDASVDGDLTNTATAVGTSPAGVRPTATDTASVNEIHPAIQVENTIYAGHDGGAGCQGGESLIRRPSQAVTWCFVVTNTGDVPLTGVTLDDAALNVDETDLTLLSGQLALMAPSATTVLYLERSATADVDNDVTATGHAPVGADVTDNDGADLDVIHPAITLDKTVYDVHDAGASCEGGVSLADEDGHPITWCFVITNTGDSPLTGVTLADADLGIDQTDLTILSGSLATLPAGHQVVGYYETTIDGLLVNDATATATPQTGADVTDDGQASVSVLDPGLDLQKTVYAGHDGGASCDGGELVVGQAGDPVTWCFTVENTGDTDLTVTVEDDEIGFSDTVSLDPGETQTLYDEGTIDGDLLPNTATATGETPDGHEVPDTDQAGVDEIHPSISVDKTVYLGHDAGAGCQGDETEHAEVDQAITWCFVITNDGDVDLTDITLDDAVLGHIDESDLTVLSGDLDTLAVDDSLVAYFEDTADVAMANSATGGGTAPDDTAGSDTDTASVDIVGPQIGIAKTIIDGPAANGDGSYTLTYRMRVQNAGETRLDEVQVTDDLDLTFQEADDYRVDDLSSTDLTVNPAYDGSSNGSRELLVGHDSLGSGEVEDIFVTVTVWPGAFLGPYVNTATATAVSPNGVNVHDFSDSGSQADPTDPNPGEPGDTSGTDDPVPVSFPPIDLTVVKSVENMPDQGALSGTIDWGIVVSNQGPGDDPGPITVTDQLQDRLDFVSASGEGWECAHEGQTVTCVWATPLAAGQSTSMIHVFTDVEVQDEDVTFTNGAHVSSTGGETRTDNNDSEAEVSGDFVPAPSTPSGSLPRTGATVGGLVLLGLALILGGRQLQRRARGVAA